MLVVATTLGVRDVIADRPFWSGILHRTSPRSEERESLRIPSMVLDTSDSRNVLRRDAHGRSFVVRADLSPEMHDTIGH
jgi:hypothetical protein